MSEMVERVATALYVDIDANCAVRLTKGMCRELARVAIAAMREPTQPMVDVAWRKIAGNLRPDEYYKYMIDAALTPETMTAPAHATTATGK